ncbi:MAG: hypothetical protein K2X77_11975 [Candidatus Obscuribacterales bacterium]|jgi:hypothetical protein|nr:hypothetical protein [Candidatus Obscuribacterales bacterium]
MSEKEPRVLNNLRQSCDASRIAEAKCWLEQNSKHKAAIEIINEVENGTSEVEDIRWCAEWLTNHAIRSELVNELPKHSHVRILLDEEHVRSNLNSKSGSMLDKLLDLASSESIFALTRKWLTEFPDSEHADFVLLNLLRADSSQQHLDLAYSWLERNSAEFTSILVLSKLIECGNQDERLLVKAVDALFVNNDVYTSHLACALIRYSGNESARNSALKWCREALANPEAYVVASMMDTALPNEELAQSLLEFCVNNAKSKWVGNTWITLVFYAPSKSVFQACWDWLKNHKKHRQWEDVFWFLLQAAAESKETPPPASIKHAWELWELGNKRWVGVMLEADRTEEMAERLFSWVCSNPEEVKTVNTILAGLLRTFPSKELSEYSSNWIKTKSKHDFESLAVLRPLLAQRPDPQLVHITKSLLVRSRNPMLTWSILELLIRTAQEPSSIQRAKQLVDIEASLSFRRDLGLSGGLLIETLLEVDGVTPELRKSGQTWLRLHEHRYSELSQSIRKHLDG